VNGERRRLLESFATMFRLNGMTGEMLDFLFSPVLGGEFRRAAR
jgi:hypothetical protein